MIKTIPIPKEVLQINLYPFSGPRYTCELETKLVCFLAKQSNGNLVEVGCNMGVTTRELSLNCLGRTIYAVEYIGEEASMYEEQMYEKPTELTFGKFVRDTPHVQLFNSKFSDFDLTGKDVGFAFIDGDHSYSAVKQDTEKVLNLFVKQGPGTIVWHDYYENGPEWCGVKKYIDENMIAYNTYLFEGTCVVYLVTK